jgi:uroporphyrinogen-III synthase
MPVDDRQPHDTATALAGVSVLVTRPRHQSDTLVNLIEARGGTAIRFPVIEILPARDERGARAALAKLDDFSLVIFVSRNAVEHGLALMDVAPLRARIAALGEASAAALEKAGIGPVLRPSEGTTSEDLLALAELGADAVAGTRVLIVRGEGGRPLLGCELSKRGAQVTCAEVYRRARPQIDAGEVTELGRAGAIDVVVVTSVEGLENLFDMLGKDASAWLARVGYVVVSERVVAARADDQAIVDALIRWCAVNRGCEK